MATVIRLDKIGADNHIVNITCASALENGRIVAVGALNADGESYTAAAPADVTADYLVLHASVPMVYKEGEFEGDFILAAGKVGRGYVLKVGDMVTITDDGITGVTVKGEYATPANTATLLAASALPGTSKLLFKVIDKTTLNDSSATVLEVVKA